MLYFKSFSSGSCGNCYYLGNGADGILVDAGVSPRRVKQAMQADGMGLTAFSAMLVTHDHLDHIRSLGAFCKRFPRPVYATPTLHKALARHSFTRDYIDGCRAVLAEEGETQVGPYFVRWFEVPHDATQTVGYGIRIGDFKFVIMTDLGRMTSEAMAYAAHADVVVIESNYDPDMLQNGPYPPDLKQRICQGSGHLSNGECATAVARFYHRELSHIFLCHLSENNNTPELAYKATSDALAGIGLSASYERSSLFCSGDGDRVVMQTLPRRTPSRLFTLREEE